MRYKVVPEPVDIDLLFAARDAVPLVPGSVEDCCTRVVDRTDVPSRDDAREWLTFLQALGLVAETDRGFYRVREEPDRETLGGPFTTNVFGAREVTDVLAASDAPIPTETVFEEVRDLVPRWERDRHVDWESEWLGRIERLLAWGVVLGVFEERDGRYTATG